MDKKYFEHIANIKELGKYHYKILLLLMVGDYSQSDISKLLDIKKQNVNRAFKDLEKLGLIEMRQHYSNYFRGIPHFKDHRRKFLEVMTLNEINDLIGETMEFYREFEMG